MASPGTRYQPQGYFPQYQEDRRRSSSAAAHYTPQAYNNQPQPMIDQHRLSPPKGGLAPPYPTEQPQSFSPLNMPVAQRPLAQQAMIHSGQHTNEAFRIVPQDEQYRRASYSGSASERRVSFEGRPSQKEMYQGDHYRRPSYSGSMDEHRRVSHERRLSHHSDRSYRSSHSHHHDRERNDYDDDDYMDEEQQPHHHHHHHEHHRTKSEIDEIEAYRQRKKDRGENVSRSFGDSMMSVLTPLKYLIEPRDKY